MSCTSFPISDSRAALGIVGFAIRSLSSFRRRSNLFWGSCSSSHSVSMSQPKKIINSLGVRSSNNLFSESVSFLGTGSSFDSGLIDTCNASGTEAAFLFIMVRRFKKTLIMSSKKQSPLPNDVVGTSTAISLAGAIEMSGSTYTAAGTLGCIGLDKMTGSQLPTSVILFERSHTISLSPQKTAGFAEAPNVSLR